MIIDFSICGQHIIWPKNQHIIARSVGHVAVKCNFDSDWDGLTKRIIFTNGPISKTVLITDTDPILIPHEVLIPGKLYMSAIGVSDDGKKKLTTARMNYAITICHAGEQHGCEPEDYTPTLWEQVLAAVGDLPDLDTEEKSNLVSAINELAANKGGSSSGDISLAYATDEEILAMFGDVATSEE